MAQNLEEQIKETELSIEEAKSVISMGEKALKLAENPLFKELILEGYFEKEAIRLTHMSSDPNIPAEYRECVNRDLHGPAALKRYLRTMVQLGGVAATSLFDYEETLDEIREEADGVDVFDNTGSEE
jgi:hypothetical protein